jgi:hypothetical protein
VYEIELSFEVEGGVAYGEIGEISLGIFLQVVQVLLNAFGIYF